MKYIYPDMKSIWRPETDKIIPDGMAAREELKKMKKAGRKALAAGRPFDPVMKGSKQRDTVSITRSVQPARV